MVVLQIQSDFPLTAAGQVKKMSSCKAVFHQKGRGGVRAFKVFIKVTLGKLYMSTLIPYNTVFCSDCIM